MSDTQEKLTPQQLAARKKAQKKFEKDKSTLKQLLRGARCCTALKALEFAEPHHPGYRKDHIVPSFHHQVQIAFTAYNERERLVAADISLDKLIALTILHDTYEDNQNIQISDIANDVDAEVAQDVVALSKVRNGKRIPDAVYYHGLLEKPILIIAKLLDRRNNVGTIFELPSAKQVAYVAETRKLIKLAKDALNKYPELESILQHAREQLKTNLNLYLGCARMALSGKMNEVLPLLQKAGHLPSPPLSGLLPS